MKIEETSADLHYIRQQVPGMRQDLVSASRSIVIGAGGVGSPLLIYLTGAGAGRITLFEDDKVELHNLPRQILYRTKNVGQSKGMAAAKNLKELNQDCQIDLISKKATTDLLLDTVGKDKTEKPSLIIDASDNGASMVCSSRAAYLLKIPYIAASAEGNRVMVMYYDYSDRSYVEKYGCLECLGYTDSITRKNPYILGPVSGIAGVFAALNALEVLSGMKPDLYGRMLVCDEKRISYVVPARDKKCPMCSREAFYENNS